MLIAEQWTERIRQVCIVRSESEATKSLYQPQRGGIRQPRASSPGLAIGELARAPTGRDSVAHPVEIIYGITPFQGSPNIFRRDPGLRPGLSNLAPFGAVAMECWNKTVIRYGRILCFRFSTRNWFIIGSSSRWQYQLTVISSCRVTSWAAAPQERVVVAPVQQPSASSAAPFGRPAIITGSRRMGPVFSCRWAA